MQSYQSENNDEESGVRLKLSDSFSWRDPTTYHRHWKIFGVGAFLLTTFLIMMGIIYSPDSEPIVIGENQFSVTPTTPEPFVFPERVRLQLDFYVNTPKGKVRGTNTGYIDWSSDSHQPYMRWDELYDIAEINDMLPLLYDGVAGPNAHGQYKYWSMDRNGLFKCTEFPFPEDYPRDLLKQKGKYLGQKLMKGKMTNAWSYKFMGVTVIIYVDAADNTKLVQEEISIENGKPEGEIVQVYDNIELTPMNDELDSSIFTALPNNC